MECIYEGDKQCKGDQGNVESVASEPDQNLRN